MGEVKDAPLERLKEIENLLRGDWAPKNYEAAARLAYQAVAETPYDWRPWFMLAKATNYIQKWDAAEHAFSRTLAMLPESEKTAAADCWLGLATLYDVQGRREQAIHATSKAIELVPQAASWLKHADVLRNIGRFNEAEAAYARALRLDPTYVDAKHNRSFLRFRQGRWREGWRDYASRWKTSEFGNNLHNKPKTDRPKWTGMDLGAQRLLVWPEQGFGDLLWALRYVPIIHEQHPKASLTLAVPPMLVSFVAHNFPACTVVSVETAMNEQLPHDCHVPLLDLPNAVGCWEPFPETRLTAPDPVQWDGPTVGLVWAGRWDFIYDALRSTKLRDWLPALAIRGVRFVSLQIGPAVKEALELGIQLETFRVPPPVPFSHTADLVANMDLVVGVDTSTMHLASLLGVPTWWLIGDQPDWRWGFESHHTTTPWYTTARFFRKLPEAPWAPTVEQLTAALKEKFNVK